jgi:urea transporter
MSKIVLTDAKVTINSVILSDHIASITLETKDDIIETTAFGVSGAAKTRVAGLADNSVTLDFHQDFASANVEATIYPLLGTATTVVVQPASTAVSTTNPTYTFSAVVVDWTPLKGGIGQLATASVTWPITGAITKATA